MFLCVQDALDELDQAMGSLSGVGEEEARLEQLQTVWEKTGEVLGPTDEARFKVRGVGSALSVPLSQFCSAYELTHPPSLNPPFFFPFIPPLPSPSLPFLASLPPFIPPSFSIPQAFEKIIEVLSASQKYKDALAVATALQSQLQLTFTTGAAEMLNKVEEHIKK